MNKPCIDCKDRFVGCHGNCDKYKTFVKEFAIAKENKKLDDAVHRYKPRYGSQRTNNFVGWF